MEAAKAMHMCPSSFRQLLSGVWLPSAQIINRLAVWAGMPVDTLCSHYVDINSTRRGHNLSLLVQANELLKKALARAIGLDCHDLTSFMAGTRLPNSVQFKKLTDYHQIAGEDLLLRDLTPAEAVACCKSLANKNNPSQESKGALTYRTSTRVPRPGSTRGPAR